MVQVLTVGVNALGVDNSEIKRLLIKTLNYHNLDPNDLLDSEPLLGGKLRIDSLDLFDLMAAIDETYGVTFKDEDVSSLRTIKDVTIYVNQQLAVSHEKATP